MFFPVLFSLFFRAPRLALERRMLRSSRGREYVLILSFEGHCPPSPDKLVHGHIQSVTGLIHVFVAPVRRRICSKVSISEVSYKDKEHVATSVQIKKS